MPEDPDPVSAESHGDPLARLEAVRRVCDRYDLATAEMRRTCIASLLDGQLGAAGRHDVAFTVAAALRGMGLDEARTVRVLRDWANRIGYGSRKAERSARDAYKRRPNGEYVYAPPGRRNKPHGRYESVLGHICREVGCPDNCPAR